MNADFFQFSLSFRELLRAAIFHQWQPGRSARGRKGSQLFHPAVVLRNFHCCLYRGGNWCTTGEASLNDILVHHVYLQMFVFLFHTGKTSAVMSNSRPVFETNKYYLCVILKIRFSLSNTGQSFPPLKRSRALFCFVFLFSFVLFCSVFGQTLWSFLLFQTRSFFTQPHGSTCFSSSLHAYSYIVVALGGGDMLIVIAMVTHDDADEWILLCSIFPVVTFLYHVGQHMPSLFG